LSGIDSQNIRRIAMDRKTIVIALGGNAILQPKQQGTAGQQMENVRKTCFQIAYMIEMGHRIILTHGNGPQVGNILIQNNTASAIVPAMPLYICGAQSQGLIGYMMQQQLGNILRDKGIEKPIVTIVSQMVVDKDDPAFKNPSKPVGPFYGEEHARKAMEEMGENWIEDSGRGWRKVVPSPRPKRLVEINAVKELVDSGCVVIANGGGGIPVVENGEELIGIEAVIDKDFGGKRLATELGADIFMILTDVSKVYKNYGKSDQEAIDRIGKEEVKRLQRQGHFKKGSMGPKVEACMLFVESGGEKAIITSLDTAIEALKGQAGTTIQA